MGTRLMLRRIGLAGLLASSLAACASTPPTPTPAPRLVTQPFFEPVVVDWALAYREGLTGPLPFDLDTRTRGEGLKRVEQGKADLIVTSGEPPAGWFATPAGRLGMAVVVHPDNPVRDLTIEELRRLVSGQSSSWADVGGRDIPVQPVLPLPGEPLGESFASLVLGEDHPWPGTLLAPTAGAMVEMVGEDPGAIGVVPLAAVTDKLHTVRIDGVLPSEASVASGSYPLTVDLLATAPVEPGPPLRDFLAWLQSRIASGQ